jgi:hypothetical protein
MSENNSIRNQVLIENEKIAIKAISGNIFSLIQNIRNGAKDEAYQRRWVWELLQNAMDTTNSERPTNVMIFNDIINSELSFKHNGNPFKIDNITRLVNQQSSKPRSVNINDRKRTIGKFGTGFITTHLLSEKVTLKSTIDADKDGHKHFSILLDRSGKDEQALYDGVSKSNEVLLNLDSLPNVNNYIHSDLNTEFLYHLDTNGIDVAQKGIEDLSKSLPFTMAFVRTINKIEIINEVVYKYMGHQEISNDINLHNIYVSNGDAIKILTLESKTEDVTIAIQVKINENKIEFVPLDDNQPRLYCNYPFIGTEGLNIPVIFNSSSFNVYQERRNGITLKDADTDEILENKKLIIECKNLFFKLLDFLSNDGYEFTNTYILANYIQPPEYEWLSKKWYEDNILKPIQEEILKAKVVEVLQNGEIVRFPIISTEGKNIMFPYHKDESVRNEIYNLCIQSNHFIMPLQNHIHIWHKINWWDDKFDLSIKNLSNWFSSQQNILNIQDIVGIKENFIQWIENYINIFNNEDSIIGLINQNKLAIYPNQNGKLTSKNIVHWDNADIPEALKDILLSLGIDVRHILLNKDILVSGGITIDKEKIIDVKYVIQKIKDQVNKLNSDKMKGIALTEENQLTFKKLYLWLCENNDLTEYFGELYKNKETRLLDEVTIKLSIESDQKTKFFMEKYGLTSIDELEDLMQKKNEKKNEPIKLENLLVSIGITSEEDLVRAKEMFAENKEISETLKHFSSNDLERLKHVHKLINRSKDNVKRKLYSLSNYDCTNWHETSLTTVSGIKKNGIDIDIVIRPGDGNQIILFYPTEFDTLEKNINELWYDLESEQALYTFGRFLKKAKISRIPI